VTFGRHLPLLAPHTVFLLDRRHSELPVEQLAGRMAALRASAASWPARRVAGAEDAPLLAQCDMVLLYLNEHSCWPSRP
jgi:EAL and modified HD-GYP domain-containing signal transduction protein